MYSAPSPGRYLRAFSRMFYLVMFVALVMLPGLTAPSPKPPLDILKAILIGIPMHDYLAVGGFCAALLIAIQAVRNMRTKARKVRIDSKSQLIEISRTQLLERMKNAMQLAQQISLSSIYDAVKLPGGNGLASPLFEIPSEFFGVFSWQYVEEGTEALIIDGKTVRRSDPVFSLFGLFQHRRVARRVLLRPAPLIDLSATALTDDQLSLTLTVSVQYSIKDPQQAATLERPIEMLQQRIIGALPEYIHRNTLTNHLRDNGTLRAELRERLNESASIRDVFTIVEVLKALPSGSEWISEIGRKIRTAEMQQPLIALENQNKLAEYGADHQIAYLKAQLDEQRRNAEQARVMQQKQVDIDAQKFQNMATSLALAASTGTDPTRLAEIFLQIAKGESPAQVAETPKPELPSGVSDNQKSDSES